MSSTEPLAYKLSICVSTFNRASAIGVALANIVSQLTSDVEVVVLDGASSDDTGLVVSNYACKFSNIRYVRRDTNSGFDRDFDHAVQAARGEYCWLLPDDDLLKYGAISAVLETLDHGHSLVIVNAEIVDAKRSTVLVARRPEFDTDRIYRPEELDRLSIEAGLHIGYVGSVVIKRSIWLTRERARYYGTLHTHLGVIFQKPLPSTTLVMAKPLVVHRYGNQLWLPKTGEMFSKMPSLLDSLSISPTGKRSFGWKGLSDYSLRDLLLLRAMGLYSWADYRHWVRPRLHSRRNMIVLDIVAVLPGLLLNTVFVLYYSATRNEAARLDLATLKNSPYHLWNWSIFRRRAV